MVKKTDTKRSKDENKVARSPQQNSPKGKRKTRVKKNVDAEAQGGSPQGGKNQDDTVEKQSREEDGDENKCENSAEKKAKKRKKSVATESSEETDGKSTVKKGDICTERDALERVPLPGGGETGENNTFTVVSWNVNGLRAVTRSGLSTLQRLVETERPDLFCFQETKLQEKDVGGIKEQDILPGYDSAWSCSTTKKGYAGSAVFFPKQAERWVVKGQDDADGLPAEKPKKQGKISTFFAGKGAKASAPTDGDASGSLRTGRSGLKVLGVRFGIGDSKHDGEGRSITVEYDKFFVVTLYVPNSGQKLERLSYRTEEWDPALRVYVQSLEAEGKPVVVTGDLNVAHLDLDIYNCGSKHILKTAGTTEEERKSFDSWMKEGKMVDAFRHLHPDARGAYTYWSVRTNARPENKGLRLDYFLCSKSMLGQESTASGAGGRKRRTAQKGSQRKVKKGDVGEKAVTVHDCFQLDKATVGLSDHCPVGLVLQI